ncbi:hypothetical protein BIW11_03620 [Tropilaelaps mercedesae]|uniref:Uncharacterized protein n=1 Tax=Tropilaelaps mercedesae TaxID=418985 RepID=A0A1V9XI83_9ACAR|nr:hypothetical protein BIW11_03620 [Tropilaelaps mercedesae]
MPRISDPRLQSLAYMDTKYLAATQPTPPREPRIGLLVLRQRELGPLDEQPRPQTSFLLRGKRTSHIYWLILVNGRLSMAPVGEDGLW